MTHTFSPMVAAWSHPGVNPPSTSPHFLCCWGHRPLILWGTETEEWGELFCSFPSSHPLRYL